MSFDGLFTRAMTHEIQSLQGGRISKLYQPSKNEILLHIRAQSKNQKLLISTHPTYARFHLTNHNYDTPAVPPMFCMLLRKHLEGGIIEGIYQIELERIVEIHIKSRNEIGDEAKKILILEIMGRHSNIILTDENKTILDSIKHLSPSTNSYRTVLPGFSYVAPPPQHKQNPLTIDTIEQFVAPLDFLQGKLNKQLVNCFAGISPLLSKELLFQAGLPTEKNIYHAFQKQMQMINAHSYTPTFIKEEEKEYFYYIDLKSIDGEHRFYTTLSELLDRFYFGKAERDRVKQQAHDLERFIQNELAKNENKIEKLKETLTYAHDADIFQKYGELITAYIYQLKRGDKVAEVIDYYEEDGPTLSIPLDVLKTPAQNAQAYFQKYQKAKNSIEIVQEQIDKTKEEVGYFEALLQQIQSADTKDIMEIREELEEGGYVKKRNQKNTKKMKQTKPILDHYLSTDGTTIIVGKNNKQNDYLTNKLASRDDIWLHTKDIPGSHVVIRSTEPSETTLREAATLAAYYSKAKASSSVPVDFTKIRYVKKPSGSKPGFVIYDNQQTLYVTPNEDMVLSLKQ
ncbi:MAG: NFACT family protein [Bacillaceae bacterium]